jgi:site-specific DNA recombinase
MINAALYARISLDVLGTEKGVARQLEDARLLAQQRGWTVACEYVDNDVSAYNGDARKQYQRLMADAEARRFDQIIVWQTSRLWRNRAERGPAINHLGRLGIAITACKGPSLDLSTAYGRGMAGLIGEFDSMESEVKSERQIRANLQKAQEGKAAAFVPYGWKREKELNESGKVVKWWDVEHPVEAGVIRDIARRLLEGESMRAIIEDLNARGVPSPRRKPGFRWNHASLKAVMLRPSNIGRRVHQGQIIGKGDWPAILDNDTYARLVARLNHPDQRKHRDGLRHYLLSGGVGECGVCGGELGGRTLYYRCEAKRCVQRKREQVDELVGMVVIERLSRPDAAGIFDADDSAAKEARERAEAVRARLDNAADEYAAGSIDARQLSRITARLRPELEAAEAEARRSRPVALPESADGLLTDKAAAVWAALPVTAKRMVLEIIGLRVVINRRQKAGPGFEAGTVQVEWHA